MNNGGYMNRIMKMSTGALGLVASLIVMVSFQNCGKIALADAVNADGSAKLAGSAAPTPDSLIIDIKSPTSPLLPSEAGPVVHRAAPSAEVNLENPNLVNPNPAGLPSVENNSVSAETDPNRMNPSTTTNHVVPANTSQTEGVVAIQRCKSDRDDEDDDNDTDGHSHVKNQARKHSKKPHHAKHGKKHGDKDENEVVTACDDEMEEHVSKKKVAHCGDIEIQDILLSIRSASTEGLSEEKSEGHLEIVDADKTISLNKTILKLKAHKNKTLKELFLGLNPEGNKVLNKDLQVMNLKTAVSKGAGIKVKLDQETTIKEGHEYSLRLTIEQEEQIVDNPAKCSFKPVIKVAILDED